MEIPTKLDAHSDNVVVSPDKLSVKYAGKAFWVGAALANKSAPTNRTVYYFEMRVKNVGWMKQIAIGFTKEGNDLERDLGWLPNSIGYHGNDGRLYKETKEGVRFGERYTNGDIVGAGIKYASNEFFFTKNGWMVGTVNKEINCPLFPTVSLNGQYAEVDVNFGQKSFAYDLELESSYPYPDANFSGVNDSISATTYDESWKKLLEEKDKLIEEKAKLVKKIERISNCIDNQICTDELIYIQKKERNE
ncbi:Ran-binding protein M homolog [Linum perenne]